MVLGSGRTWPHDFRFFVGFFSELSGAGEHEASDAVSLSSLANEGGVMMLSNEFIVEDVAKREGYMSPGTDINDSAGEASNLT